MADSVIIEGVSTRAPHWALEETQKKILHTLEGDIFLRTDADKVRKEQRKAYERGNKDNAKYEKNEVKRHNKLYNLLKTTSGGMLRTLTWLPTQIAKSVIAGGASLEIIFKKLGQSIVEGSRAIPIFGGLIAGVVSGLVVLSKIVLNTHQNYLTLFETGVTLNGSLIDLIRSAGTAGLRLSDFSAVLEKYSVVIQRIAGSGNSGVEMFGLLNKQIRQNLLSLGFLGINVSEIAEYLGEYLETQRIIGVLGDIDRIKTANAVSEYIQQLTKLSVITGKQRKMIADQVEQELRDSSFAAMMSTLTPDAQEAMRLMMATMTAYGGDSMTAMFRELSIVGVAGMNENTRMIAAMAPEFANTLQRMSDMAKAGTFDEKQMNVIMTDLQRQAANISKQQFNYLAVIAETNPAMKEYLALIQNLASYDPDEINHGIVRFRTALDSFLSSWGHIEMEILTPFYDLFADILEAFMAGGGDDVFKAMAESFIGLSKFIREKFLSPENRDRMAKFSAWLGKITNQFVKWVEVLVEDPGEALSRMLNSIGNSILDMWSWLVERMLNVFDDALKDHWLFGLGSTSRRDAAEEHIHDILKEEGLIDRIRQVSKPMTEQELSFIRNLIRDSGYSIEEIAEKNNYIKSILHLLKTSSDIGTRPIIPQPPEIGPSFMDRRKLGGNSGELNMNRELDELQKTTALLKELLNENKKTNTNIRALTHTVEKTSENVF